MKTKIKAIIENGLFAYKETWKLSKKIFIFGFVSSFILTIAVPYAILFLSKFVIEKITQRYDRNVIPLVFFGIVGLFILNLIHSKLSQYNYHFMEKLKSSFRIKNENDIIDKVSKIEMEYFETPSYYNLINQLGARVYENIFTFSDHINKLLSDLIGLGIGLYFILVYKAWIAVIYLILQVPFIIWIIYYENHRYDNMVEMNPIKQRLNYLHQFLFSKNTVIETKLMQSHSFIFEKRSVLFETLKKNNKRFTMLTVISDTWGIVYSGIFDAAIYLIYGMQVLRKVILISDFYFIQGVINSALNAISSFIASVTQSIPMSRRIEEYKQFINLTEERQECPKYETAFDKPCDIKITNLSFRYPESERFVLCNITLHIKAGQKVAIVGANGAGKTTLSRLILGLFNRYEGEIFLNNTEYGNINNRYIYDNFSVVMQDYYKYPFTIRDNIIISRHEKISDENELNALIQKINAAKIIQNAPNAYDTYLNKDMDEGGTDLSEGQWQKLMLVRALYRDKHNIIFDEPTASLDPMSEEIFYKNVFDEAAGRTLIIITHRLACTVNADLIVVMDNGKVIENGTHKELMDANGFYCNMFTTQAEGYQSRDGGEAHD